LVFGVGLDEAEGEFYVNLKNSFWKVNFVIGLEKTYR
jgi:hypothetical protein